MSIIQLGQHWLPDAGTPASGDVLFLAPLSDSPLNRVTADKSPSLRDMALSDFTYGSTFYGHSLTTAISADTLFGALTTLFSGGTMWTTNSYDENHFNLAASIGTAFDALKTSNYTFDAHAKIASVDNTNSRGGWVLNCGGLGYALSSPPNFMSGGGNAKGMFSMYIDGADSNRLWVSQGTVSGAQQDFNGGLLTADVYNHIRVCRTGMPGSPVITVYVNGQSVVSAAQTQAMAGTPSFFHVGGLWNQSTPGPSFPFRGHLANVRICKVALCTGNFTPPFAPYPITW